MTRGTGIQQSEREETTRRTPAQVEHGEVEPGADPRSQHVVDHNPDMWLFKQSGIKWL